VDAQWTVRGGDRKNLNNLLDRLTQMSEGSQGGVRYAAVKLCGTVFLQAEHLLL